MDEEKKKDSEAEDKRIHKEFVKKNKHKLLQNEHVEVKTYAIGKNCSSYSEAYALMIEDIRNHGISVA